MTRCGSGNAHNVVVNASPAGARPDDSSPIDVPHLPVTILAGEVVSKPPPTPLSGWPACATGRRMLARVYRIVTYLSGYGGVNVHAARRPALGISSKLPAGA